MRAALLVACVLGVVACGAGRAASSPEGHPSPPRSLRLRVFDCGTLHVSDTARFDLRPEEVAEADLSVACVLVTHPRGKLIWDPGAVPDMDWRPIGNPVTHHLVLADSQERDVTLTRPLVSQLAEVGVALADVTYLALSHYHYDHTANANEFAGATWLVRRAERDAMFAEKPPGVTQPSTYAALRDSRMVLIESDDYDVFGDGRVRARSSGFSTT